MKALVSGGAGFVGSHLVDALAARGDEVLVLDDLSTGRLGNLESALAHGVRLTELDVADQEPAMAAVTEFGPDALFHLAAQIDVRVSVADPGFDARLNVVGTVNMLEAARRAGTGSFIFASTGGAIYGEGQDRPLPFEESAECLPDSPYGQSKLAAEGYVEHYRRLHGLQATSLRFGNVYGPRQDPHGEAGVIAIFCGLAVDGGVPTVYGDGRQTRDYIYVGDVVSGLLAAAQASAPGPINLGTGVETDVLELVARIAERSGREDFVLEISPERPGEVQRTVLATTLAGELLSWSAATGLDQGLEHTLAAIGGGRRGR